MSTNIHPSSLHCSDVFDTIKSEFPEIEFFQAVPRTYDFDKSETNLVILDDLMNECIADENVMNIFTKWLHHRNTSEVKKYNFSEAHNLLIWTPSYAVC